jgi:hypothetical protein
MVGAVRRRILLQQVDLPVAHGALTPGSRLSGSGSLLAE